ncbi:VOC family protein [uncultured Tateyamaria sp.]|uniref:VOC family protein n=1 Tax=uncultured Tateyamaria sp. TaxID=455651 RepID=UPI00262685F1|nr:VOC family protein [uncultured Tateyamaria sp.]
MAAQLEHTNFTVTDPDATAKWMCTLFDWHIRWTGDSRTTGYSVHVGTDTHYLALYAPKTGNLDAPIDNYTTQGGLNHIAVVVDDIAAMRARVEAAGFEAGEHFDYEPGQRFYFYDTDHIEYEVVQYD